MPSWLRRGKGGDTNEASTPTWLSLRSHGTKSESPRNGFVNLANPTRHLHAARSKYPPRDVHTISIKTFEAPLGSRCTQETYIVSFQGASLTHDVRVRDELADEGESLVVEN